MLLAFLPPYSPDYNPIEEYFSVLKRWMKQNTELSTEYEFKDFLEAAVEANTSIDHVIGHFKHAGIGVDTLE